MNLRLSNGEDQRRSDNGRPARSVSYASITLVVGVLGSFGGLGLFAMDLGAQKQRIDTIEKRQIEDRTTNGQALQRLDGKIEQIDGKVNVILQEIRSMQAENRAESRAAERRTSRKGD